MIKKCVNCGQEKEHHAKGLCFNCYTKTAWTPRVAQCKRCGMEKPLHAKDLCRGCYQFIFQLDKIKAWNQRKNYGLDIQTYKRITSKCVICDFDKVVDLHHLDHNKENNSESNLIGLCPNHHKMLHDFRYRQEMFDILKQKGYSIIEDKKLNFKL